MRKKQASNSLFSVNVELMLFGLCWVYLGQFGSDVRQVLGQSFRAKNYIIFSAQKKSLQTAYTLLMLSSCWASIGPCCAYLGYVGSFLGNLEAMSGKSWAKAFALRTTYFLAPKRKPSNSSYWVNVELMLGLYWAMFGRCLLLDLSLLMRSGPWILWALPSTLLASDLESVACFPDA